MIDCLASETQFVEHLAPIWLALPPEARGSFAAHRSIRGKPADWGIVPTDGDPSRPVLVASYGDQKRARRLGYRRIARIEHGAGQSYHGDSRFGANASYAGGRDCHDVSLFLCPNEYSADRWQAAYPGADVEIVGCPKLDSLPRKERASPAATHPPSEVSANRDARASFDESTPPTVCISFHFDINLIPETRSAFPAYRPFLTALAKRYNVIGHGHPKGLGTIYRYLMRAGIEVVTDFAEVCRRADLYAVDNSSTLFEFASTGRPVVVLNDPGFRKDVHHGGRFWNWAGVGPQVDIPATIGDVIEQAFSEDWTARREAVLAEVYPVRSGAARLAAEALMEWAGIGQAVAA